MGRGKVLQSAQSPDGDSPTTAAAGAGFLSSLSSIFLNAPSTASQTHTRPSIPPNPVLSLHQRFAWQLQTQSSTSSSTGSSGACSLASTAFIISILFLLPVTFFTIATVLDLEILVSSSDRPFSPLGFMTFSNSSIASWGKAGVKRLPVDGKPWTNEEAEACSRGVLKVFVYDIPLAFSVGMISLDQKKTEAELQAALRTHEAVPMLSELTEIPHWPDGRDYFQGYPTNWMERDTVWKEHTAEHYLTADMLTPPQERDNRSHAVRVMDPQEADVFFLPLYASCFEIWGSRGGIREGAEMWVLNFLLNSPWWQRNGGSDHVIPVSQPVTFKNVRKYLSSAIFIVTDFWIFPSFVSNLTKDVVAPYNHLQPFFSEEDELRRLQQQQQQQQESKEATVAAATTSLWSLRDIWIYFRGSLDRGDHGKLRSKLRDVLSGEPGVIFSGSKSSTNEVADSMAELRRSKFCLHLVGDTPTSCRFFDAVASGCVPIVVEFGSTCGWICAV